MLPTLLLPALLALVPGVVAAQSANPYNGPWTAKFALPKGDQVTADVVINGTAGTWRANRSQRGNNCVGVESPIEVQAATADELRFRVLTSKALAGCNDFNVTFAGGSGKSLSGKMGDGRAVVLEK